ncbi:PadR family transcriptional regulator [Galbitalea soli]|uniref:PadR family transcriptional regulator n=1 Tax=Galbitalea soli TaxID=1268042 RepID=A0A7C9TQC6_9MICO|nr:PadR family transcriptional regulator [Galbitalea soli]
MSVRLGLLAILNQGPCYGYQLRREFDRRTGSAWPMNIGQVYTTLDRLVRDRYASRMESDGDGQVTYAITDQGRSEVDTWLSSPVVREGASRDELVMKLAIAVTLPGVDIARVIQAQRTATLQLLQSLTRVKNSTTDPTSADELAWLLTIDAMIFAAEGEVRWLDHSEARLVRAVAEGGVEPLPLSGSKVRRGRPVKAAANE